jgi:CheY-like chemotaxis protein
MDNIRALIIDDAPHEIEGILEELISRFSLINVTFSYSVADSANLAVETLLQDKTTDIVFLDIFGIDPYITVIPRILDAQPYLPIIMLSDQEDSDEIIHCIDLGAHSFIIKSRLRLRTGLRRLEDYDDWADEQPWKYVLAKIRRAVDDYRPLKRALSAPLEIGTIRKKGDRLSIIRDQIDFLLNVQGKPKIAEFFPSVQKEWPEGDSTFYEMPFFRMKSFRRVIFEEPDRETCLEMSKQVLNQVLEVVFNRLYTEDKREIVYDRFITESYFEKFKTRLQQLIDALSSLKKKYPREVNAYSKLLDSKVIEINGKELRNPTAILSELESIQNFSMRLKPPFLCLIHGDLHFDNILVDDRLPKRIRIKFIDPRGFRRAGYAIGSGDIAYDLGKLLHSAHGGYDLIHAGYWTTNVSSFEYKRHVVRMPSLVRSDWATVPQNDGGSGDVITSHKQIVQPWVWGMFEALADHLRNWIIEKSGYSLQDPNWWLRAKFNEAMHFCTMGRFHVYEDIGRAIAIHIRGIEIMNEFRQDYENSAFDS